MSRRFRRFVYRGRQAPLLAGAARRIRWRAFTLTILFVITLILAVPAGRRYFG